MRYEIGLDKLMWGSDYPHREASYPYTKEHLRLTFEGVPADEIEQMVTLNAAALYGFDLDVLAPAAAKFGPRVRDTDNPLQPGELPIEAFKCPAFAGQPARVG